MRLRHSFARDDKWGVSKKGRIRYLPSLSNSSETGRKERVRAPGLFVVWGTCRITEERKLPHSEEGTLERDEDQGLTRLRKLGAEQSMVRRDSFLGMVLYVLCFLHANFQRSFSQNTVQPTALLLHLNQSAAQVLIQQANSVFVSNTSISDISNDNETQQMMMRYRERKRQVRLMTIQRDILQKLGLARGPNVTSRLSAEERESLVRSFDRTMVERVQANETSCTELSGEEVC